MAVRHTLKNSNVQFRNATANQLGFGELALNYHESGPYLQCKDADGTIVQLGGTYVSATAPLNPIKGKQWLNTSDDRLYIYSGTAWVGTKVVNVSGDLPEPSAMTTADLNLDQPSTRLLPDSSGLATQKDLNIWFGDALDGLDGRVKFVEQDYTTSEEFTQISLQVSQNKKDIKSLQEAPAGGDSEINLDDYATKAELDDYATKAELAESNDRIAALEAQVELLASLVPPVDYGNVVIQGGNDYDNGQCWLSPDETGVFMCSLTGSHTTGCRYSWEIMRGQGRFSGSTTASTVTFICQTSAPGTVVLRCTVSHPTTEETVHGEITILVQPAD